jgi:Cell wall synthesis protein CwsA
MLAVCSAGKERRHMSAKTESRLTPRERLARGLTYSTLGPADVTRGVVGLSVQSAQSTASQIRRKYQEGRLAKELAAAQETLAQELAAAQEVVAGLPQALQDARRGQRRGKRPWVIAGVAVAVLAGGAVAFSVVRRSVREKPQDPQSRPPSVDVQPRP